LFHRVAIYLRAFVRRIGDYLALAAVVMLRIVTAPYWLFFDDDDDEEPEPHPAFQNDDRGGRP
jgi:hypothetical protein